MFWHQRFHVEFSFSGVAPPLAQSGLVQTVREPNTTATAGEPADVASDPDGNLILPVG